MSALAFASCGGGSAQFKDMKKMYNDYEKRLGKVDNCDSLRNLSPDYKKFIKETYADKDKMTPEEKDKLIIMGAEIQVKENEKGRKLSCKGYDD